MREASGRGTPGVGIFALRFCPNGALGFSAAGATGEEIAEGENVEIRLTLTREGDFHDAEYYIGYIQMKGKGEVTDDEGTLLVNRELHALDGMAGIDRSDPMRQGFTLWYRSLSDKNAEIRFIVRDNFGQQAELAVSFDVGRKDPQTE